MPDEQTVYLIDGNAYIYRAYHAISPLTNKEGLPTHAAYGFINILRRIIREKSPKYLAIAFDAKGPTFRHQIYNDYKSNRPPMPEDLVVQLPYIKEIVKAHNILTMEQSGVEADDLLASAAQSLAKLGHPITIVTGDKDLLQLVSDSITVWDPMSDRMMDTTYIKTKYNVTPPLLTDLFALIGDKSDNVPGVPSVGPKTAEKLINEFNNLELLFDNIDSIKRPKLKQNLQENKQQAFLSRQLIELKSDIAVPDEIENYLLPAANDEKLKEIYTFLDFKRLTQEKQVLKEINTQSFHLINNLEQLSQLTEHLANSSCIVIDTETTSIDPLEAELVGISICTSEDAAFYLPISHQEIGGGEITDQISIKNITEAIGPFLTDSKIAKLGHNLKYDYTILARHGIVMQGELRDTLIASYLIEPTKRSHKLDTLSQEYLNIKMTTFSEVTKGSKQAGSFRYVPVDDAKNYSCEDVACTLLLWQQFEPQLDSLNLWPLFSQVELPLIPILADMESHGILIDSDLLGQLSTEFGDTLKKLDLEIFSLAGDQFNINSTKQLATILFEKLKLPHGRKTKTGYSTDMKVLEKLANIHDLPKLIIEHRILAKLKSTYVDKLPTMINSKTERLHTSFNQAVTATGRLSSSNPNLQNIPIRSQEGQRIRAAFIPAPGCCFIGADYSQIDLRVLAHYSQDAALTEAFCHNDDIHQQTAAEVFKINPGFVTNQMRQVAKSINFGIVYGMSAFGLSEQLRISRKEAATFIERYFEHYKGVKKFMEEIVDKAKANGYVTTLLGRRRVLPDINSPNKTKREFAERTALNTPIQGTAADIIKIATIQVAQQLQQKGLQARILLQIHDELILEVPEHETEQTSIMLKEIMESVLDLSVPLLVNISVSPNLAKV